MEAEIQKLRDEVKYLSRKVDILEKKEKNRVAMSYLKILIKVIVIGALSYGIYWGYRYVVNELPNVVVEKVKDLSILDLIKK
jgi:hypothetical protein